MNQHSPLCTEQEALALLHMTKEQLDARVNAGSLTAYNTAAGRCFDEQQVQHYALTRALAATRVHRGTLSYTDEEGTLRRTRRIGGTISTKG